ncbi:hypothetical protein PHMEG_00038349, partial [Phytophthora megakarya]
MFEVNATNELEAKFEVMDSDDPEAYEQTKKFPQELPMENDYELSRYFVRSCYPEYYDLILNKLEEFQIVTVTGTTGIGMSVFYGYFFERCKSARPPSYNFIEEQRKAALQRKDKLLFLYDGPPQFEPKYPTKMVCFVSPNENWLKMMAKKEEA